MSYYDCEETDRAVALHFRRAEREGRTIPQPSRAETRREGDMIVIAAATGHVYGRYRVAGDGRLRRLLS